jgi:hypothetical protein
VLTTRVMITLDERSIAMAGKKGKRYPRDFK